MRRYQGIKKTQAKKLCSYREFGDIGDNPLAGKSKRGDEPALCWSGDGVTLTSIGAFDLTGAPLPNTLVSSSSDAPVPSLMTAALAWVASERQESN